MNEERHIDERRPRAESAQTPDGTEDEGTCEWVVILQDIYKRFGDKSVLEGLDLKVRRGETFCIVGPSGCGKSVTLKIIMGLLKPDSGRVILWNEEFTDAPEKEWEKVRSKMGMVFQAGALFDSLTVGENVGFALSMHTDLPEEEIREIVRYNLELVGLPGIEDKMPSELSGGMKKRVSLARAIALKPRLLLYDEPTTGLDPIMTAEIDHLVLTMQKELKVTSIIVTHDLRSARRTANRMAVHWKGRLIATGTPDEIERHPDPFVQQFIHGRREGPMKVRNG